MEGLLMKKIIAMLFFVVLTFCMVSTVYADSAEKIEISFKVGDEILKINGEDVKVQKPFVVNGVTLVPLRVITEAFGSEVEWNGEEQSILLKYDSIEIKLVIGSKTAIVNGIETTMLEAPVLKDGVTMVPLRFITENFGADVTYIGETKEIVVVKEIVGVNSIRDFGLILKKTTKERVGDSYYKWSISFPKQLEIEYRSFDGTVNKFSAKDDSYILWIRIRKHDGETIDSLHSEMLSDLSYYTILSQGKFKNEDGDEYVCFSSRDSSTAYEDRAYIKDGRIFEVNLIVNDYKNYTGNDEFKKLMDSFRLAFPKDETTEDLSDVNSKNYRTYQDKTLGWSIEVPAEWDFYLNDNKAHEVTFEDSFAVFDIYNNSIDVRMYSIEEGMTLDKFFEMKVKEINEHFNPELVKIHEQRDGTINGIESKELLSSVSLGDRTIYMKDIFIFGEKYRYLVWYTMDEAEYNKPASRSKMEYVVKSFKFTEPEEDKVGVLTDPNSIDPGSSLRKVSGNKYKWSFEIPSNWTPDIVNNGETTASYSYDKYAMKMTLSVLDNITYNDYIDYYENTLVKIAALTGMFSIVDSKTVYEKGATIKKYTNSYKVLGVNMTEYYYVISKNSYVYTLSMTLMDICKSQKNLQVFDDIWNSMSFE